MGMLATRITANVRECSWSFKNLKNETTISPKEKKRELSEKNTTIQDPPFFSVYFYCVVCCMLCVVCCVLCVVCCVLCVVCCVWKDPISS